MCLDPVSSQFGLDRFENLAESKTLSYNLKKSSIVILGKKKAREKMIEEFEETPSKLYDKPLDIVNHESYLGDVIGINTSESITLTINKRIGLAKKAIFEIKNIVEDCRSKVIGGIKSGILIWESCVIPFLLNNCSTWINMKKCDTDRLNKLQNLFLNTLLNVKHCPIPIMYLDLSILTIPMRILQEKLILYHHISSLPDSAIAKKILQIQENLHLPSLYREIDKFLIENEICDVRKFSKREWKAFVRRKILTANQEFLLESSKNYKKIDSISLATEKWGIKDYFSQLNLTQARIKFRERAKCMNKCKRHYSNDYESIRTKFVCPSCNSDSVDVLSHWRLCPSYEMFREFRNLNVDEDLMAYYQDIIAYRSAED